MTKREAYIGNNFQLLNRSLPLIVKNSSLPSATSVLSPSRMADNTTVSLDKLTRTDYVEFKNC